MAAKVPNLPSVRNDGDDETINQHYFDVKCLLTERDKLRNEIKSCEQLNQLLRRLINLILEAELSNRTQNEAIFDQLSELHQTRIGTDLFSGTQNQEETKFFSNSYPKGHSSWNRSLICKGCNKNFKLIKNSTNDIRWRAYTRHCIKECDKYQALGLIGHCSLCKLSFTNRLARSRHMNTCHEQDINQIKPKWMSNQLFKWTMHPTIYNTDVNCKGCQKLFKGRKQGNNIKAEFDYYVHCIEQCEEYKKLNLIRECKECKIKFIGYKGMCVHWNRNKKLVNKKRRSWMNSSMVNRKQSGEFNTTVNCKGCGKLFKAQKNDSHLFPELDYFIHCVEECADFKKLKLIQKCPKCNKIYLTKAGYTMHVRLCR